jgi:hypothetical protein
VATKTTTPKLVARVKPYHRTEALPELAKGVKLPKGYTPAYFRKRKSLAVLRAVDRSHYLVFSTATGEKTQVTSTKEASQLMSGILKGKKKLAA